MVFDNRALLAFLSLTRTLSFTRSAVDLGLTQPRLSYVLRKLEGELGFDLFFRTTRRVEITPAGKAFLPYAQRLEEAMLDASDATHQLRGVIRDRLRVGAPQYTMRLPVRLHIIEAFREAHAATSLEVTYGRTPELLDRLREDIIDVAFLTDPVAMSGLQSRVIAEAPLIVVMPKDHPLTRLRTVPLEALKGQKIVCPPRATSFKDYFDRRYADAAAAGATLIEAVEDDAFAMLNLAAERGVLAIGPSWPHWTNNASLGLDFRIAGWIHRPMQLHIARRAPPHSAPVEWIWKIAMAGLAAATPLAPKRDAALADVS